MITSDQIASQIAYSNQNIQPMPGAHSYAFSGGAGAPAWRADTPGFGAWGPGLGDRVGSGSLSGASSAMGFASMVGLAGGAAKWAGVGPSWLHSTRYLAGFGMPMIPGMMATMAPAMALNQMAQGAQNQMGINNTLMQTFGNRVDMGGRGGLGMGRSSMMQVGNMVRELSTMPELMSSVGELSRIMERMSDMNMFQGVRDVAAFKKQFKSTVENLRDVSRILGSTMEEALPLLQEARQAGLRNPQQQMRSLLNRQATTMMGIGISQGTVGGVQAFGADLGSQMGGNRATGAMGAVNLLQTFSVGLSNGSINEDDVGDLTGQYGEKGLAALAQMTQGRLAVSMKETGMGKLMTAALGEVEGGKFTGKINQNIARMVKEGRLSRDELVRIGQDNLTSKGSIGSFERYKDKLAFSAANEVGFEGLINQIQEMMRGSTQDDEEIVGIVAKQFLGGDQRLADLLMDVAKNMRTIERKKRSEYKKALTIKLEQAAYKDNHTLGGKWDRFKHFLSSKVGSPFEQMGADAATGIAETVDSLVDTIMGRGPETVLSDRGAADMRANLFGLPGGTTEGLTSKVGGRQFMRVAGTRMDVTDFQEYKHLSSSVEAARRLQTLDNMSSSQRSLISQLSKTMDSRTYNKKISYALENSDTTNDAVREAARVMQSTKEGRRLFEGLRRTGAGEEQIVSAVQEQMGLRKGEDRSFIDFNKYALGDGLMTGGEITYEAKKELEGELFKSTYSLTDLLGAEDGFTDSTLRDLMAGDGPLRSVFLSLATKGSAKMGTSDVSMDDFLGMGAGKLSRIAKSMGVAEGDLAHLQKVLSSELNQAKIAKNKGKLQKLRDSDISADQAMAYDQLDEIIGGLQGAKSSIFGDELSGVLSGLKGIRKNPQDLKAKATARQSITTLSKRFKEAKTTEQRQSIINEMTSAGVPDEVIRAMEVRADFLEKESSILTGSGQSEAAFFEKMGIRGEDNIAQARLRLKNAGLIDGDLQLTAEEEKKSFDLLSEDASLGEIISGRKSGGLSSWDKQQIKDKSYQLMIDSNVKFVQAVSHALGKNGMDLSASAAEIQKASSGIGGSP